jgi:membrane-associated phospholipid phosphatase
MRFRELVLVGAMSAVGAAQLSAQSVGSMIVTDIRNTGGDMIGVWTAPFHAPAKSWIQAGVTVGSAAIISIFDDDVDRFMVRNQHSSVWSPLSELREGGSAFSGKTITPIAAGVYVIGLATKNTKIRDGVWGCIASYGSESLVRTQIFYRVTNRERPDSDHKHVLPPAPPAQQGDQYHFKFGDGGWGMHSLPAGHVANVAACASFLGNRFHMGWVEPAMWAVVAGVGVGRMVDRRHWMSDTFLGTVMGYAAGKEVAKRSLDRMARNQSSPVMSGDKQERGFYLSPGSSGVTLGWHTTF